MSVVAKRAGRIKIPVGTEVGFGPGHIELDGDPAPPSPKGAQPRVFGPCLLWPNGRPSQLLLSSCCNRVVNWNSLLHWQSANTTSTFKTRLDKSGTIKMLHIFSWHDSREARKVQRVVIRITLAMNYCKVIR